MTTSATLTNPPFSSLPRVRSVCSSLKSEGWAFGWSRRESVMRARALCYMYMCVDARVAGYSYQPVFWGLCPVECEKRLRKHSPISKGTRLSLTHGHDFFSAIDLRLQYRTRLDENTVVAVKLPRTRRPGSNTGSCASPAFLNRRFSIALCVPRRWSFASPLVCKLLPIAFA